MIRFPQSCDAQLDFDKIRQEMAARCQGSLAREWALSLEPFIEGSVIEQAQAQGRAYTALLHTGQHFPNAPQLELQRPLSMLAISGAVLEPEEFLRLARATQAVASMHRFFSAQPDVYPALQAVIADVYPEPAIIREIDTVLTEQGQVKDNASPELLAIRIRLSKSRQALQRAFARLLRELAKEGVLTETGQSFRNGRKVLSVFAEHKRKLKGILHGESDTGKTAYIEPQETVELNNDIYEAERAEEREVYRILRQLTATLSVWHPLLVQYREVMARFDFLQAGARLGIDLQSDYPQLTKDAEIRWVNARHPVLWMRMQGSAKKVVPLQVHLDREKRILVISGPNAGGKTVCLKTIALLQLMVQCGLPVPCSPQSRVGVFRKLFIDIGDAQSIENELSTYSSHLQAMKWFLEEANGRTLFCIDEFGTGSDPALGGAFAEVILEELARRKCLGVVTTHYLNLKVMAGHVPGILNGAMLFDEEHLQPLFTLQVGRPGSSYTFDIARRSGLPPALIDRARTLVGRQHVQLDEILSETEQLKLELERQRQEVKQQQEKSREVLARQQQELERIRQKAQVRAEEKVKLNRKEQEYIRKAEKELRMLLQAWQKAKTEKDKEEAARKTSERLQQRKEERQEETAVIPAQAPYTAISGPLTPGDWVWIRSLGKPGRLGEKKGRHWNVLSGDLQIRVEEADLVRIRQRGG